MAIEAAAREQIDALLAFAGWHVCDAAAANIHAARGVAIREFPLPGHGFADYLLYVDGKAAGVIEAKKAGLTLSGVETQSAKYTQGLPASLPAWYRPLPFSYQSTGAESRFTNGLDPEPRSRPVFAFHKPELLARWLDDARAFDAASPPRTGDAPVLIAADAAADRRGRTCPMPRIAVTVDMIATDTDIKAVEIVLFMRAVKSRAFFEQMKGRGVRIMKADDLQSVTPDAKAKDHFVIVDAVGVCEQDKTDSRPMEQKPTVSFEKLMQAVAFGNTEDEVLSSLAGRLARMEHRMSAEDDQKIRALSGGLGVKQLSHRVIAALDVDRHIEQAKVDLGIAPDDDRPIPYAALTAARSKVIQAAVKPFYEPKLRETIDAVKKKNEIVIDIIGADEVLEATFSKDALERAKGVVRSFEQFIADHKDEITALQVLYSNPYKQRLTFEAVKEWAEAIHQPPHLWTESQLWSAYAALEKSKVKGASGKRILTDLVSLVRLAIHQDSELIPFPERVNANFRAWLAAQQFSPPLPASGERVGVRGDRFTASTSSG